MSLVNFMCFVVRAEWILKRVLGYCKRNLPNSILSLQSVLHKNGTLADSEVRQTTVGGCAEPVLRSAKRTSNIGKHEVK